LINISHAPGINNKYNDKKLSEGFLQEERLVLVK